MAVSFYNRFNQKTDYKDQRGDERPDFYQAFIALKRDLQNLLNAQPRLETAKAAAHGVSGTVLNYGLANLKNFSLQSDEDQEAFRMTVQQCIQLHEPRLTDVSVKLDLNADFPAPDLTIHFKVCAAFMIGNEMHPLELQSSLNMAGGNIVIKDIKNTDDGQ